MLLFEILLNVSRQSFIKLEKIKILIFDEHHHARGRHPYVCITSVSQSMHYYRIKVTVTFYARVDFM